MKEKTYQYIIKLILDDEKETLSPILGNPIYTYSFGKFGIEKWSHCTARLSKVDITLLRLKYPDIGIRRKRRSKFNMEEEKSKIRKLVIFS